MGEGGSDDVREVPLILLIDDANDDVGRLRAYVGVLGAVGMGGAVLLAEYEEEDEDDVVERMRRLVEGPRGNLFTDGNIPGVGAVPDIFNGDALLGERILPVLVGRGIFGTEDVFDGRR